MAATLKLTKRHARKILSVVDCGLSSGVGNPVPGELCIMAAFNLALGRPHGDNGLGDCVGEAVRQFDIGLNDAAWSSNEARAKGMRREAIAKIGSNQIDQKAFAVALSLKLIQRLIPAVMEIAAKVHPDKEHAKSMRAAGSKCKQADTLDAASDAASAASDAARAASYAARAASYAASAASYAARAASDAARAASDAARAASDAARAASDAASAASDAARAASYAARAACYAASAASYAASAASYAARAASDAASAASYAARAASDAASAACYAGARDKLLTLAAECAVDALTECGSPGVRWLDICD